MDDFNFLLHREQIEHMNADRALCAVSRHLHLELARRYGALIDGHRHPYRGGAAANQATYHVHSARSARAVTA